MNYDGTLVMPSSYALMDEEEMCYVEGGGSATVIASAENIRNRLTAVIGCSLIGTAAGTVLGGLIAGIKGAVVTSIIANNYFGSFRTAASSAHHKVEKIISKYSKNKRCKMVSTYSVAWYCTGISVSVA